MSLKKLDLRGDDAIKAHAMTSAIEALSHPAAMPQQGMCAIVLVVGWADGTVTQGAGGIDQHAIAHLVAVAPDYLQSWRDRIVAGEGDEIMDGHTMEPLVFEKGQQ